MAAKLANDAGCPGNAAQSQTCGMIRESVRTGVADGTYSADARFDAEYDAEWRVVIFEIVSENGFSAGTINANGIVSWL